MAEARLASSLRGCYANRKACSCLYTSLALAEWAIINTGPGVSRVYRTVSSTSLFHADASRRINMKTDKVEG